MTSCFSCRICVKGAKTEPVALNFFVPLPPSWQMKALRMQCFEKAKCWFPARCQKETDGNCPLRRAARPACLSHTEPLLYIKFYSWLIIRGCKNKGDREGMFCEYTRRICNVVTVFPYIPPEWHIRPRLPFLCSVCGLGMDHWIAPQATRSEMFIFLLIRPWFDMLQSGIILATRFPNCALSNQ